jgi:uncharacterized repeat protein (TIGR01451 family)
VLADAPYNEGQLLVRFASKTDGRQRTSIEKSQILISLGGGSVKHEYKNIKGLSLITLPSDLTVKDALKTYNTRDEILYAEPDYFIPLSSTFPNDTFFPQLWGLHNTGQTGGTPDADIDAPEAWDISTRSDIIVAVIDSGVDYIHPDLADNIWVNTNEIPNNGIDDDNNGYVDDIRGWDFDTNDNDPMAVYDHGTHCAGIIGAVGNNGEGVTGVCWNAKIMALNISHYMSGNWGIFVSNAVEGIEYAVNKGAKVLSNSWGSYQYSQSLKDSIEDANTAGVLFIAAAGNDSRNNDSPNPFYPASYNCNNIISVMATDNNDEKASWSNYGANSVDLAAPGTAILSCVLNGYYDYKDGTSMATPYVAGACALVWSRNQSLNYLQVKNIILNSVDQKPALNGLCVTGGRLNLYKALAADPTLDLTIADNVINGGSVLPGDNIAYTIRYRNPVAEPCLGTVNDVNITDFLPVELDFNSASGPNSVYDPCVRTVTWRIGTLSPRNDFNSITLTVKVNELAEPLGTITNTCVIEANKIRLTSAAETTDVNSWRPNIIYVNNQSHFWPGTGMSWKNAYWDLQDALTRAGNGYGSEIWVATGNYYTHTNIDSSYYDVNFALVDGVALYGGFAGIETARSQRNWLTNQTILNGDIDGDGKSDTNYLVKAANVGPATIIDGFTITGGYYAGIQVDGASPTIRHNKITRNQPYYGISCTNQSSPNITECNIFDNTYTGIHFEHSDPNISLCLIKNNTSYGIDGDSSSVPVIKNNWMDGNSTSYCGIYLSSTSSSIVIRNNTIINNTGYGIWMDNDVAPITNCIVWGNSYGSLRYGYNNVKYSCIQGNPVYGGNGNINTDPCFVNAANKNFHLGPNSPCIDKGDPCFVPDLNETDIDGEPRIFDGDFNSTNIIDIGADEFYWSPADFDRNKIVNFIDYAILASAWLTISGQPHYNSVCDIALPHNNKIDVNDLARFCDDWLWQPAWVLSEMTGDGFSQDNGSGESLYAEESTNGELVEGAESSEQSLLEEEPQEPSPGIWLVYDGNMLPNPGDEITVYTHSDPFLLTMATEIEVTGDANIISAMGESDCNSFGWDFGLSFDPYLDSNDWFVDDFFVDWGCTATGTVSYLKFRYNSGVVTIFFTEYNLAYDAYGETVLFSEQPLVFGDPNQN